MSVKIRNVSIMSIISKNSIRCLISAKNLSENTQRVIYQAYPLKKRNLNFVF